MSQRDEILWNFVMKTYSVNNLGNTLELYHRLRLMQSKDSFELLKVFLGPFVADGSMAYLVLHRQWWCNYRVA